MLNYLSNIGGCTTHLLDVFHTLGDVVLLFCVLGVVRVNQDGRVGLQGQFHHLSAQLGQVSQRPQQLQDFGGSFALTIIFPYFPY